MSLLIRWRFSFVINIDYSRPNNQGDIQERREHGWTVKVEAFLVNFVCANLSLWWSGSSIPSTINQSWRTNIISYNHPNEFKSRWWNSIARRDSLFDATIEQIYLQYLDSHPEDERHSSLIQRADSTQFHPTRISISWFVSRDILASWWNSWPCLFNSISVLE